MEIIFLSVKFVQYLYQLIVALDNLKDKNGVLLDGWIGWDVELVDDKIELALTHCFKNAGIVGLVAVVGHVFLMSFLPQGFVLQYYCLVQLLVSTFIAGTTSPTAYMLTSVVLGFSVVIRLSRVGGGKEGFDAVVDLPKIFIAAPKLDGIPLDLQIFILVHNIAIVHVIGIVGFGEDILDHRPGVDQPLTHPVVLQS